MQAPDQQGAQCRCTVKATDSQRGKTFEPVVFPQKSWIWAQSFIFPVTFINHTFYLTGHNYSYCSTFWPGVFASFTWAVKPSTLTTTGHLVRHVCTETQMWSTLLNSFHSAHPQVLLSVLEMKNTGSVRAHFFLLWRHQRHFAEGRATSKHCPLHVSDVCRGDQSFTLGQQCQMDRWSYFPVQFLFRASPKNSFSFRMVHFCFCLLKLFKGEKRKGAENFWHFLDGVSCAPKWTIFGPVSVSLSDLREVGAGLCVNRRSSERLLSFRRRRWLFLARSVHLQHFKKTIILQHGPSPNIKTVWSVGLTSPKRQKAQTSDGVFLMELLATLKNSRNMDFTYTSGWNKNK